MLAALTLVSLLGGAPTTAPSVVADEGSGVLSVGVRGLRSDAGHVLFVLYADAGAFPDDDSKAVRKAKESIHGGVSRATWRDVPHGTYAVAVVHDENDNEKLDTNFLGIPKEGIGASNGAQGRMGPPKWKKAKFQHAGEATAQLIKIVYL
jgi:uncharacterized protein (DUF2141 family)